MGGVSPLLCWLPSSSGRLSASPSGPGPSISLSAASTCSHHLVCSHWREEPAALGSSRFSGQGSLRLIQWAPKPSFPICSECSLLPHPSLERAAACLPPVRRSWARRVGSSPVLRKAPCAQWALCRGPSRASLNLRTQVCLGRKQRSGMYCTWCDSPPSQRTSAVWSSVLPEPCDFRPPTWISRYQSTALFLPWKITLYIWSEREGCMISCGWCNSKDPSLIIYHLDYL